MLIQEPRRAPTRGSREAMLGRRFGRLAVVAYAGRNERGDLMWACRCDCGGDRVVRGVALRASTGSISCGCRPPVPDEPCVNPRCDNLAMWPRSRGYCSSCYHRVNRYGDALGGRALNPKREQIRTADGCLIDTGPADQDGYVYARTADGHSSRAHQVAFGPTGPGLVVDHECHNRAMLSDECAPGRCEHRRCVERSHLRAVTSRENSQAARDAR